MAFLGANPEAGEIGARVIYNYHDERLPVFLLAAWMLDSTRLAAG